jgi:hypothetical protein
MNIHFSQRIALNRGALRGSWLLTIAAALLALVPLGSNASATPQNIAAGNSFSHAAITVAGTSVFGQSPTMPGAPVKVGSLPPGMYRSGWDWIAYRMPPSQDGTNRIWVNYTTMRTIVDKTPDKGLVDDLYFQIGWLVGTLGHEQAHICLDPEADNGQNELLSCEHIAITYTTLVNLCSQISALHTWEPSDPDVLKKIKGMCAYHKEKCSQYNTEAGANAAKACTTGSPPYTPPGQCGVSNPPPPPGGSAGQYPGNQVMPKCQTCVDLGLE